MNERQRKILDLGLQLEPQTIDQILLRFGSELRMSDLVSDLKVLRAIGKAFSMHDGRFFKLPKA